MLFSLEQQANFMALQGLSDHALPASQGAIWGQPEASMYLPPEAAGYLPMDAALLRQAAAGQPPLPLPLATTAAEPCPVLVMCLLLAVWYS